MAGIRFGSINTGLPPNIVDQLMEAERIPIKSLQDKKGKDESKAKLVDELATKIGDIRKGLGELASARGFSDIKLISGDPNTVTGTVDPGGYQVGSWNVEVISLAQKASAITNGFPDKDTTTVGTGYLRFDTPDGDKDIYISPPANTLEGVAKTVNASKMGIRASVISDRKNKDYPYKLVLSADGVGEDKNISYPRIYMLDGDQDLYFDGTTEAKNGVVKVDGIEFEINDNELKDVIPGVTLELRQANPGRSVNLSVKEDMEIVLGKIKSFVDGMNGVLGFIQQQNKLDKNTDTTKTLGGDSLLRSVENRIRQICQGSQLGVKGPYKSLGQIGIQFNRNGLLEFDQKTFNSALQKNAEGVQNFFVGDGFSTGFVATMKREISTMLNPAFGPITNRQRGLKQKIDQVDQSIANKERQLEKKEQLLRDKFARLEETMSKIKSSGGAVGGMGGGGGFPGMGGG
jgi:flagellar hook-associated protein 2